MKVTLTLDGKSVELDLTAEQMETLGLKEEEKKTGYEKVGRYKPYHYALPDGRIYFKYSDGTGFEDDLYDNASYHSDKGLAEANARADRLMRQLRRFAAENGGIPSLKDWATNGETSSLFKMRTLYTICYDYANKSLIVGNSHYVRYSGAVYFNDYHTAKEAMELYRDELIWYFTEYEAMLR